MLFFVEFINPYGIRSSSQTQNDSESSSDRLSQFGTARDYPDFDMQNDPYWYNEKDDDHFMTPSFEGPDFFGCYSEDKFIMMTLETENQCENPLGNCEGFQLEENGDYMDKPCLFNNSAMGNEKLTCSENYGHIDKKEQLEERLERELENDTLAYNGEVPFCKRSDGSGESCGEDHTKDGYPSLKEIHLNDFHLKILGDSSSTDSAREHTMNEIFDYYPNKNSSKEYKAPYDLTIEVSERDLPNGIDSYKAQDHAEFTEECQEPDTAADGEDITDDELLKYTHEDEYEVFDLRIIHRKNRFVLDCLVS